MKKAAEKAQKTTTMLAVSHQESLLKSGGVSADSHTSFPPLKYVLSLAANARSVFDERTGRRLVTLSKADNGHRRRFVSGWMCRG